MAPSAGRRRAWRRQLFALGAVLFVGVGGFIAWDAYQANEVRGWVEAPVMIDPASARLDEVVIRSNGRRHRFHVPLIEYDYVFEGVAYRNDDVYVPRKEFRDRREAQAVLDDLVADRPAVVLVDPDSPDDSTLSRSPAGITRRLGGLVALAVGLPLVLWLADRWNTRERRRWTSST